MPQDGFFILGAMPFTEVFAGIAVRDREAAIAFYERLLGAPPTMLGPVETVAGSVHTTWITDPDGNRVQIGQPG